MSFEFIPPDDPCNPFESHSSTTFILPHSLAMSIPYFPSKSGDPKKGALMLGPDNEKILSLLCQGHYVEKLQFRGDLQIPQMVLNAHQLGGLIGSARALAQAIGFLDAITAHADQAEQHCKDNLARLGLPKFETVSWFEARGNVLRRREGNA